jgi:hypothetical protein
VHGIIVFGGTFPAEIWHSLYAGAGVPCEEFNPPDQKIVWAPFFGRFTAQAPGSGVRGGGDAAGRGAGSPPPGSAAVGGYNPDAYAPGVGQEPAPAPPPPPPPSGGNGGDAGVEGGSPTGGAGSEAPDAPAGQVGSG